MIETSLEELLAQRNEALARADHAEALLRLSDEHLDEAGGALGDDVVERICSLAAARDDARDEAEKVARELAEMRMALAEVFRLADVASHRLVVDYHPEAPPHADMIQSVLSKHRAYVARATASAPTPPPPLEDGPPPSAS